MKAKKAMMLVFICCILLLASCNARDENEAKEVTKELIRFHVIANSDSPDDQYLKNKVRDRLITAIEPELAGATSINEATSYIKSNLILFEMIASKTISDLANVDYPITAVFGQTNYPTRVYGELVLPAGSYQSLQVKIGEAKGANWWCVLFPPLCFVDVTRNLDSEQSITGCKDCSPGKPIIKFKLLEGFRRWLAVFFYV
jgi:stage II sporulation protein R